jgi:hypothetical protein
MIKPIGEVARPTKNYLKSVKEGAKYVAWKKQIQDE